MITVEDHYAHGGLGDCVLAALADTQVKVYKLAVHDIPRSGKPAQLLDAFGISASHVVRQARAALGRAEPVAANFRLAGTESQHN